MWDKPRKEKRLEGHISGYSARCLQCLATTDVVFYVQDFFREIKIMRIQSGDLAGGVMNQPSKENCVCREPIFEKVTQSFPISRLLIDRPGTSATF